MNKYKISLRNCIRTLQSWTDSSVSLLFVLVISINIAHASGLDHRKHAASEFDLHIQNGICTLQAESASLHQVLLAIAEQSDIRIWIQGDLNGVVRPFNYQEIELTKVLRDLVRNYSTVMLYQSTKGNKDTAQKDSAKIMELWVYVNNSNTAQVHIQTSPTQPSSIPYDDEITDRERQIQQIDRLEGLKQQDVIDSLAERLRQAPDPLVRIRAVTALAKIGGASVLPALGIGMSDRSPSVRSEIARAFGDIHDQHALLSLGQLVMGDKESHVREAAVRALAKHSGPAARSFIDAARKDEAENVRNTANEMLLQ